MKLTVLSWNLYHGRDFPPDRRLLTRRSRFLRLTERNETHAQVNRDLRAEFTKLIASIDWDVALLQECPPRWIGHLAATLEADAHHSLTSRNRLGTLRSIAARLNPDLIASAEGGSNVVLSRAGALTERRERVLTPGPEPERRTMAFAVTEHGVALACLHASLGLGPARADTLRAAEAATAWAGNRPLVFGGDLNAKPGQTSLFEELEGRHGLSGGTEGRLDHVLSRGGGEPARPLNRELTEPDSRRIRLSDHPPIARTIEFRSAQDGARGGAREGR